MYPKLEQGSESQGQAPMVERFDMIELRQIFDQEHVEPRLTKGEVAAKSLRVMGFEFDLLRLTVFYRLGLAAVDLVVLVRSWKIQTRLPRYPTSTHDAAASNIWVFL